MAAEKPDDQSGWFGQKVPIWVVLAGLMSSGGLGLAGGQWHANNTEAQSNELIAANIVRLREDQLALTEELRQATNQLRIAMDRKVDIESKRELVEAVMHRLDLLERHVAVQDDRFTALLNSLRGGPH